MLWLIVLVILFYVGILALARGADERLEFRRTVKEQKAFEAERQLEMKEAEWNKLRVSYQESTSS